MATPAPRTSLERRQVRSVVDRLLGLRIDLTDWYEMSAGDARLRLLADRFRGMKPPQFPTMFEAVVNAFACQQLSLEVGLELLNRLATIYGVRFGTRPNARYAFPTPNGVAQLRPEKCRAAGFSHQKVRALLDLAGAIARRELDLEAFAGESDPVVRQRLLELRGVGRWTAEYVLLRGLGRLHIFPGDDVGAQKRLARWLGRSGPMDYTDVCRAVERWQPYAGLVYFHLLLDVEFRSRSGFMRLRPTLLRTARSVARSASSMAACSATCRRWITTLGRPLSTTFTLHSWSTPPRGPFTSVTRTLMRSIDVANFPSFMPSLRLTEACSSSSRSTPIRRTWAGVLNGSVRPLSRFRGLGIQAGIGARCAPSSHVPWFRLSRLVVISVPPLLSARPRGPTDSSTPLVVTPAHDLHQDGDLGHAHSSVS